MLNGTKEAIPQQINYVAVLLFITDVRVAPTKWIIFCLITTAILHVITLVRMC